MKYIIIILLCCAMYSFDLGAQEKRLISYDLTNGQIDTLEYVEFDQNILSDKTEFYIGNYSKDFSPLDITTPTEYLVNSNSLFTYKQRAADYYDLNQYPIRTIVKLFRQTNGELKFKCSGSIISPKHVLTACHCVMDLYKDTLLYDNLLVAPIFNDGEFSSTFKSSRVEKVYKLDLWKQFAMRDFAILELAEPIGLQTGWLSIGFDEDDKVFENGIFYKFSYPGITVPTLDPRTYNGDTLYFNYGHVDIFNKNSIGVKYATGIPGESGSPLILIENGKIYTIYGTATYASNIAHSRIDNSTFYTFNSIIAPYINNINLREQSWNIKLDFNSISNNLSYELPTKRDLLLRVINLQGIVKYNNNIQNTVYGEVNLSTLMPGIYILIANSEGNKSTLKFIKH